MMKLNEPKCQVCGKKKKMAWKSIRDLSPNSAPTIVEKIYLWPVDQPMGNRSRRDDIFLGYICPEDDEGGFGRLVERSQLRNASRR